MNKDPNQEDLPLFPKRISIHVAKLAYRKKSREYKKKIELQNQKFKRKGGTLC